MVPAETRGVEGLLWGVIDTHCHLTFPDFAGRLDEVLAQGREHGVTGMITVSTTPADAMRGLGLAQDNERIWCSAGVHPLYSDQGPHDWDLLRTIIEDEKCVAWGELGLDNHYDKPPREIQDQVLEEHLRVIQSADADGVIKPIIIHCREAFADLIPVLRASGISGDRFVFHCFTGGPEDARMALDLGAMISFTGVVTYKNARDVQEAALLVPQDRIMAETDAPFLSPTPHRGTRPCEPWMSSVTARFLADLRGEDWNAFHTALNTNTQQFFNVRDQA